MHDIEKGHRCSSCRRKLSCTIEDGYCENEGTKCNQCLQKAERKSFRSRKAEEEYRWLEEQQDRQDREDDAARARGF